MRGAGPTADEPRSGSPGRPQPATASTADARCAHLARVANQLLQSMSMPAHPGLEKPHYHIVLRHVSEADESRVAAK
jgi:hypothetical protein